MPSVKADTGMGSGGPAIRLSAYDIIAGHGSPAVGLVAGFVAGALLWVPIFGVLFFNRFLLTVSGASTGVYGGGLGVQPADLVPYIIATGFLGVLLAFLRRTSARIGWYKDFAGQRLGLNDVVATVLGALICIVLIASGSQAGLILMFISIGVLFGGFMVNAAWEAVHNRMIAVGAARSSDAILARAVRHELTRSPDFSPQKIDLLTVERGKLSLKATWENDSRKQEAREALQGMPGITMVQFVRND